MQQLKTIGFFFQHLMQRLALFFFAAYVVGLTTASIMATVGYWAWVDVPLNYAGEPLENAGMFADFSNYSRRWHLFFPTRKYSHYAA
jgi:hypothetical protein|tara:strand:- start:225 stop:485 length:261 start_codon:yes stop_codon:yes gene_type:complete